MVLLHKKFIKGIKCKTTYKQFVCPYAHATPGDGVKGQNILSENGHVVYQIKGNFAAIVLTISGI